jgi:hypothetical protein
MLERTRRRLVGMALAASVPFGIALLAHSPTMVSADPLASVVGGVAATPNVDACAASGPVAWPALDNCQWLTGEDEPAADVDNLF